MRARPVNAHTERAPCGHPRTPRAGRRALPRRPLLQERPRTPPGSRTSRGGISKAADTLTGSKQSEEGEKGRKERGRGEA